MKKLFNKQRATLALATIMMVSIIAGAFAASSSPTFTDVPSTHWAYAYIERAADEGWMNGVGNNQFNPGGTVTNAEFFTMLGRAYYAEDAAKIEADYTGGNWWYPASKAAQNNGVLDDTDLGIYVNAYGAWPDNVLFATTRRDDMALAIYNLMGDKGFTASQTEMQAAQSKIGDWSDIKEKYQEPVSAVYALGIITGTSDGTFAPERGMTRAEAATVLCRLDDVLAGKESAVPDIPDEEIPEVTPEPEPGTGDAILSNGMSATEDNVLAMVEGLKAQYPNGSTYDATTPYYVSQIAANARECAKLAWMLSDNIFGNLPVSTHSDLLEIKPGDVVEVNGGTHWFFVLSSPAWTPNINGYTIQTIDGGPTGEVVWNERLIPNNAQWEVYTRY